MSPDGTLTIGGSGTSPDPSDGPVAIEATGIKKVYGGTAALASADFSVRAGEIHGLLGENGAGKSTLVRVLAGVEQPDRGTVRLWGQDVTHASSATRDELGVAFIHQDLALIPGVSIAENIAFTAGFPRRFGIVDRRAINAQARAALDRLGVQIDVEADVDELPIAAQTVVAIARAVATGARLIVLDEPTAKLQAAEVQTLFTLLGRLREDGCALVLITHRLPDVLRVCDRVTVFRDGRDVAVADAHSITTGELVKLIVGSENEQRAASATPATTVGARLLELAEWELPGAGPLDMHLCRGEILGVTGLADAGHLALAESLFGLVRHTGGSATLNGRSYGPRAPHAAIAAGMAYVPSDRHRDGVALDMTAVENIFLRSRRPWYRRLRSEQEATVSRALMDEFDVRPPDPERELSTFSGGNQQKIVLAKWLRRMPDMLILSEPTAAVDVGAKFEIYEKLRALCAERSLAILVASSDFEEVVELCDRVVVLRQGRIIDDLAGDDLSIGSVTEAAFGAAV